jgi:type I restriction enzyme S subunit
MLTYRHATILGDVPRDWGTTNLKDILVRHLSGDWGEERGAFKVNVLRSTNLTNEGKLDVSDVAVRCLRPEVARLLEPRKGDLLLERSGGGPDQPVGRIGFVESSLPGYAFSNFIQLLRPNPRKVCARYLGWVLHQINRSGVILRLEQQTTQMRNLHFRDYLTVQLPLPQPEEQRAVACILDALEVTVERTRGAVDGARRLKRGLIQEFFTKGIGHVRFHSTELGSLPTSWEAIPVGKAITEAQYGLSMPMGPKGRFPILRMAAIQHGDVLLDDLKYVDLPDAVAEQYLLKRGDVLFNRTNSAELVGKVGIYRHDQPAVFASYLIRLKVNPEVADSYFLGQLLAAHATQCRIKRYATPGVQQVNINATNVQRVLIPIPTGADGLREQRQIADVLEKQDDSIKSMVNTVKLLERLKRGLMQDLLTGSVRVKLSESAKAPTDELADGEHAQAVAATS